MWLPPELSCTTELGEPLIELLEDDAAQEAGSAGEFVNEYLDCDETVGSSHHTPGSVVDVGPETWAIFNTDDLYIGAADTTQIIMCTEPTDH